MKISESDILEIILDEMTLGLDNAKLLGRAIYSLACSDFGGDSYGLMRLGHAAKGMGDDYQRVVKRIQNLYI